MLLLSLFTSSASILIFSFMVKKVDGPKLGKSLKNNVHVFSCSTFAAPLIAAHDGVCFKVGTSNGVYDVILFKFFERIVDVDFIYTVKWTGLKS